MTDIDQNNQISINEEQPKTKFGKITLMIAIVIGLATFSIWFYSLSGLAVKKRVDLRTNQPRDDAPDLFDDSTISINAEATCAKTIQQINGLPPAQNAKTLEERAEQIQISTLELNQMIDSLKKIPATTERDQKILSEWTKDWEQVIDDRNRYIENLENGKDEIYLMTQVSDSERLDKRLNRVAATNEMYSCNYPTDVG